MARPLYTHLPEETQPRLKVIVERSLPSGNKPPLPGDLDKKFAPLENKTAACYAVMEENTAQLRKINNDIKKLFNSELELALKLIPNGI